MRRERHRPHPTEVHTRQLPRTWTIVWVITGARLPRAGTFTHDQLFDESLPGSALLAAVDGGDRFGQMIELGDEMHTAMLTLIVSLEAIFLSTFVMIGQNRQ